MSENTYEPTKSNDVSPVPDAAIMELGTKIGDYYNCVIASDMVAAFFSSDNLSSIWALVIMVMVVGMSLLILLIVRRKADREQRPILSTFCNHHASEPFSRSKSRFGAKRQIGL